MGTAQSKAWVSGGRGPGALPSKGTETLQVSEDGDCDGLMVKYPFSSLASKGHDTYLLPGHRVLQMLCLYTLHTPSHIYIP